jgi:CIC family chloride channel protein
MSDPEGSSKKSWEYKLRGHLVRLLKLRVWIAEIIRPDDLQITLLWAGLVGLLGGGSSILFRWMIRGLNEFFTRQHTVGLVENFSHLSWWQCLFIPALGGILAGLVLLFGERWHGKSSTDYMEAIAVGDGRISARLSLTKSLSSLFTIASGGSIGREGPLVQLSAMLASLVGRFGNWPPTRRRLLVACGAAAGIAAAYNAPIAGALFVAEIILGSMAMEIFGPLVFASVVSTLTVRAFLGGKPLFEIPQFQLNSGWEIIPYLLLGLLAGYLSPWFLKLLRWSEQTFMRLRCPGFVRMGLGGLIVGVLAIFYPEVCGNGYSTVNVILHGGWMWQGLLVILVLKLAATSATFGSGAVGGVFTPTLFVGACLGHLFGTVLSLVPGFHATSPIAFALVAMAAFLAGTTHAPIMAILMLFEMTLDYQIILPLMLASVVAYYTSLHFDKRSIYSESLKRKGALDFRFQLSGLKVADLMKTSLVKVHENARFSEIGRAFIQNRFNYLYVTDDQERFCGAISLHDIKGYLNEPDLAELVIARDIIREDFPGISSEVSLAEALDQFLHHEGERLPVIDGEHHLAGSISKTDIILALAERAGGREAAPAG